MEIVGVTLKCNGCEKKDGTDSVSLPISEVAEKKRFSFNATLPVSKCVDDEGGSVCFQYGNPKDCAMKLWWHSVPNSNPVYKLYQKAKGGDKSTEFNESLPLNISIYDGKSVTLQDKSVPVEDEACKADFKDGMVFEIIECGRGSKKNCNVTFEFEVPTVATTVQSPTKAPAIITTEMPASHGAGFYVLVIGGPLVVLLVIGLGILIWYCVRGKRRNNRSSKTEQELLVVKSQRSGKKKRETSSFDVEPTQDSSQENNQKVAVADGYKEIGEEMLIVKQGRAKRNNADRAQKDSEEKDQKEALDQEMNQHFDDIRRSRMTQATNETEFSINKEQLAKPPVRMFHQQQPMQSEKEEKASILKSTKKPKAKPEDRPQDNSSGMVGDKEYSLKSTQESSQK